MSNPSVKLISWTGFPIETIYLLWQASRTNDPMPEPYQIYKKRTKDEAFNLEVRGVFEKVVESAIPVAENINFIFLLENVSVSFREQMVRHRIGVKVGERLGVDIIPDLQDSTWWSQSMRVLDMGEFFDKENYRIPEGIEGYSLDLYKRQMFQIQETYKMLVKAGVPVEDAREVLPLATTHRISWSLNLSALIHILKKRGCWILQLGLWEPIIRGMVEELSNRVDPYFRTLIQPPCVKGNEYKGCVVKLDNEKRIRREDPLPPCSLYLHHEGGAKTVHDVEAAVGSDREEHYLKLQSGYAKLWNRNPITGETL